MSKYAQPISLHCSLDELASHKPLKQKFCTSVSN